MPSSEQGATTRGSTEYFGDSSTGSAPLGIKLICLVIGIAAVLELGGMLLSVLVAGKLMGIMIFAIIAAILAANLIILYGLWALKSWAWIWALIFFGFGAIVDLIFVFFEQGSGVESVQNVIRFFLGILIALYIYSKRKYYRYDS